MKPHTIIAKATWLDQTKEQQDLFQNQFNIFGSFMEQIFYW